MTNIQVEAETLDKIKKWFAGLLEEHGLQMTDKQWEQFAAYYYELIEWNEKMNLTAITEIESVFLKHFFDSISLSFFVPLSNVVSIADIGSGAGFPSIPLKIMFPHLRVTIVDSLNKRISFLRHVSERLGFSSSEIVCVHGRAEDIARNEAYRDRFDLVTARAVAKLSVLNELCLPFVKANGTFVAMKGPEVVEELADAAFSLKELQGEWITTHPFMLPGDQGIRNLVVIRKRAATPKKYPRKAGTPGKSPLMR